MTKSRGKIAVILGWFVLVMSFLVFVLSLAPFTPAFFATPVIFLLSIVVVFLGAIRLGLMSVYLCIGTLLCSAMTENFRMIDADMRFLFTIFSTPMIAALLLLSYFRGKGKPNAA
jgi:hypothetical protein